MGKFITLKSTDGFSLPAYVAEPTGKAKGAIVVVQEIFGVNSHIQEVTKRFAAQGYLAIAPAAFERVRPGVDVGYNGFTRGRCASGYSGGHRLRGKNQRW